MCDAFAGKVSFLLEKSPGCHRVDKARVWESGSAWSCPLPQAPMGLTSAAADLQSKEAALFVLCGPVLTQAKCGGPVAPTEGWEDSRGRAEHAG